VPLVVICGPAGGPQPSIAYQIASAAAEMPVVLRYDANPWEGQVFDQVKASAVAGLAQRLANTNLPGSELRVPDLEALRDGRPFLRCPGAADFTPEIMALAGQVARSHVVPRIVIIDSLSRLYEQMLAEVVAAAVNGLGNAERAYPVAQVHAGDALARICWDLNEAKTLTIATAWDTQTTRSGKVTGSAPMLPKSVLNQTTITLRAKSATFATIERSTHPGTEPGTLSTIDVDRFWLATL
jgi:hypothetical protein